MATLSILSRRPPHPAQSIGDTLGISPRLPLLLGFLIAIGPVSTDMYLPAFPAIAEDFHNPAAPEYTLATYFIGLALGQMSQGPFSDRVGRRIPVMAGLALYTLASIGCALAWSTASLSAFRLVAAFGGSASVAVPRAMVRDVADGPAAAVLYSKLMLVMGVAPIVAPILGSAIVSVASWRWIFAIAAIYGVVGMALSLHALPDTLPRARRSVIGIRSIGIRYGQIATERSFITSALAGTFAIGALFAYLAGTPDVFIGRFHWSPGAYAALFAANAAIYIGFNQINPRMVARFGLTRVIGVASVTLIVGAGALLLVSLAGAGPAPIIASLLICQASYGFLLPSTLIASLSRHQAHAGSASALMGTMQYVGGAFTGAAVGAIAAPAPVAMAIPIFFCAVLAGLATLARPRL